MIQAKLNKNKISTNVINMVEYPIGTMFIVFRCECSEFQVGDILIRTEKQVINLSRDMNSCNICKGIWFYVRPLVSGESVTLTIQ